MTGDFPRLAWDATSLFALVAAAALAAALFEWVVWRTARRVGVRVTPAGGVVEWMAGLGGIPSAPLGRGEPPLVALGYAIVVLSVVFPAGLLLQAWSGSDPPGALGVIAFAPLLTALGYAVAAERALSPETTRHRLRVAGRVLFATPAWAVAVAVWVGLSGTSDPAGAAAAAITAPWRVALALALLWCGLFVLPGAAGEIELAARPWGGDMREASRAVRMMTALSHYAGLVTLCLLAGAVLGGYAGTLGWIAGGFIAAVVSFVLRVGSTVPVATGWLRGGPRWIAPVLLLAAWVALAQPGSTP